MFPPERRLSAYAKLSGDQMVSAKPAHSVPDISEKDHVFYITIMEKAQRIMASVFRRARQEGGKEWLCGKEYLSIKKKLGTLLDLQGFMIM